ncbi:MAG: 5'-methylthioadenosine/S-adenosylhomocysteine nucleosidase [Ruminococcaceae bacterium]|nr:5'-methylthioadenosine/S-adenosylhomocysteine nucleosidase [Oscillospiraceae bacterium]
MAVFSHFLIGGYMKNIKVGIIVADLDEYKPFAEIIERDNYENYSFLGRKGHKFGIKTSNGQAEVISILCGIGKVNATAAAMHLVDIGCDYLLNYGLSGGISNIRRGELTAPDKFLEHDFDLTGIGYKLCEKPLQEYIYDADNYLLETTKNVVPNLKIGTAVSGDHFICDSITRDSLYKNFSAMSCDMETAAIAYVASYSNTPFLALRRISDDAGDNATDSYREMNQQDDTLLSDYILQIIKELI